MKESRSDSNDGCAHWWQYVTIDARLFKWRSVLEFEFVVVPESAADTFTWDMCVVDIEVGRLKGRWQDGCCIKRQYKIWLGCDRHWWCSFCIRNAREMMPVMIRCRKGGASLCLRSVPMYLRLWSIVGQYEHQSCMMWDHWETGAPKRGQSYRIREW